MGTDMCMAYLVTPVLMTFMVIRRVRFVKFLVPGSDSEVQD